MSMYTCTCIYVYMTPAGHPADPCANPSMINLFPQWGVRQADAEAKVAPPVDYLGPGCGGCVGTVIEADIVIRGGEYHYFLKYGISEVAQLGKPLKFAREQEYLELVLSSERISRVSVKRFVDPRQLFGVLHSFRTWPFDGLVVAEINPATGLLDQMFKWKPLSHLTLPMHLALRVGRDSLTKEPRVDSLPKGGAKTDGQIHTDLAYIIDPSPYNWLLKDADDKSIDFETQIDLPRTHFLSVSVYLGWGGTSAPVHDLRINGRKWEYVRPRPDRQGLSLTSDEETSILRLSAPELDGAENPVSPRRFPVFPKFQDKICTQIRFQHNARLATRVAWDTICDRHREIRRWLLQRMGEGKRVLDLTFGRSTVINPGMGSDASSAAILDWKTNADWPAGRACDDSVPLNDPSCRWRGFGRPRGIGAAVAEAGAVCEFRTILAEQLEGFGANVVFCHLSIHDFFDTAAATDTFVDRVLAATKGVPGAKLVVTLMHDSSPCTYWNVDAQIDFAVSVTTCGKWVEVFTRSRGKLHRQRPLTVEQVVARLLPYGIYLEGTVPFPQLYDQLSRARSGGASDADVFLGTVGMSNSDTAVDEAAPLVEAFDPMTALYIREISSRYSCLVFSCLDTKRVERHHCLLFHFMLPGEFGFIDHILTPYLDIASRAIFFNCSRRLRAAFLHILLNGALEVEWHYKPARGTRGAY